MTVNEITVYNGESDAHVKPNGFETQENSGEIAQEASHFISQFFFSCSVIVIVNILKIHIYSFS